MTVREPYIDPSPRSKREPVTVVVRKDCLVNVYRFTDDSQGWEKAHALVATVKELANV